MRDVSVGQRRIPHSWNALSFVCGLPLEDVQELFNMQANETSKELYLCLMMFKSFLNGCSYEEIGTAYCVSRYMAVKGVRTGCRWFRRECKARAAQAALNA